VQLALSSLRPPARLQASRSSAIRADVEPEPGPWWSASSRPGRGRLRVSPATSSEPISEGRRFWRRRGCLDADRPRGEHKKRAGADRPCSSGPRAHRSHELGQRLGWLARTPVRGCDDRPAPRPVARVTAKQGCRGPVRVSGWWRPETVGRWTAMARQPQAQAGRRSRASPKLDIRELREEMARSSIRTDAFSTSQPRVADPSGRIPDAGSVLGLRPGAAAPAAPTSRRERRQNRRPQRSASRPQLKAGEPG